QGWSAGNDVASLSSIKSVWADTRFGQVWTLRVSVLIGGFLLCAIAFGRLRELIVKGDWRESSWISLAICAIALPLTPRLIITAAFDSDYGYMLAVKVVLLVPLLLLAAFNLLVVRPNFLSFVVRGAKAASARIVAWERRFRWAVAGELAVALVILGVTAFLTETSTPITGSAAGTHGSTSPSPLPTPGQFATHMKADDLDISLDIYPRKARPNH